MTTVAYVLNRCPTKRLKNKVPEEVWSGKKSSVNHLRVFGSICYKHVPNAGRKKLDDKSEAMILVGYHKTGAYRLYNPISGKIMISRDIVIDENESWNWTSNSTTRKPLMNSLLDESKNEEVDEILDENIDMNEGHGCEYMELQFMHGTRISSIYVFPVMGDLFTPTNVRSIRLDWILHAFLFQRQIWRF